ncbi:MAG TPA: hypothetical protein VK149_03590 [Sideroxyarcus sp.]|nr:hypothetical protein [Sideroxyarcus sp.]
MINQQKTDLLKTFCAKNSSHRKYMQSPIRRDGHLYATNGWIGIRIPDDATVEATDTMELQRLCALFEHGEIEFHPLPALPEPVKCKHCHGTGKIYQEECPDCDGDGDFWHGNYKYDCKECDGSGMLKCESNDDSKAESCWDCNGTGEADYRNGAVPVKIGDLHFQPHLLRLICDLPNAKIEQVRTTDPQQTPGTHFIFDGGEGVVMPIRM